MIRLDRATPAEQRCIKRLRFKEAETEAAPLREALARWSADAVEVLREARPALPEQLDGRAADAWEPLLAVADQAGDGWFVVAWNSALALSTGPTRSDDSLRVRLLADIRCAFDLKETNRMATSDLIEILCEEETAPWGDWHGRRMSPQVLARLLRPFGIRPGTVRLGTSTAKGYYREAFREAWERYLAASPSPAITSVTTSHSSGDAALRDSPVRDSKTAVEIRGTPSLPKEPGCDGVSDKSVVFEHEDEEVTPLVPAWYRPELGYTLPSDDGRRQACWRVGDALDFPAVPWKPGHTLGGCRSAWGAFLTTACDDEVAVVLTLKTEALILLKALEPFPQCLVNQSQRRRAPMAESPKTTSLAEAVTAFLRSREIANATPATLRTYAYILDRFRNLSGVQNLAAVTPETIESHLAELRARMRPVSVHQAFRTLRTFSRWCAGTGRLSANPMARMTMKVPKTLPRVPDDEEVRRLLAACQTTPEGRRNRAVIALAADAGLRKEELRRLRIADLDFATRVIRVHSGKGQKDGVTFFGDTTASLLKTWLDVHPSPQPAARVFCTRDGVWLGPYAILRILHRLSVRAGLPWKIGPHALRHYAATSLLRRTGDLEMVRRVLRHETLTMALRYATLAQAEVAAKFLTASPLDQLQVRQSVTVARRWGGFKLDGRPRNGSERRSRNRNLRLVGRGQAQR